MKSFASVVFALAFATAYAGILSPAVVVPAAAGTTLQGPSTRSAVVGPDGASIVSSAPGGTVSTSVNAGYAAYSANVVVPAAPAVVAAYSAPVVAAHGVYAPGVVAARTLVASPLTASGYTLLAPGSGLEGQYVPDYTEKLYDDGSYKGEIY